MNTLTRSITLTTAVASVLALTACTGGGAPAPSTTPLDGGNIVIAEASETTELDPQISVYDSSWRLQDLVYDSLVTTNAESEILPSIAESWTEDGTSYTFTLREDVAFSNGRALTAADVVGSLQRLTSPDLASYWAGQLGPITGVTAVDDRTVRVDLATAWAPFLAALASVSAAILPMEELAAGTFDPATDMLGTGPFQLDEHVQDQEWTFSANAEYWGAEDLKLSGVEVKIVPDDAARVAALRDGSADIAYFANPDAPTLLAGVINVASTVQASSDMYWLILNSVSEDSPFTDIAQRQAIATSIDRDTLVTTALADSGVPTAVTPAGLPGACTLDGLPTYGGDAAEAEQILSDAGAEAATFDLIAPPYLSTFDSIAQVLQQDFTAAGFDATLDVPEMGAYVDSVYIQNPADFDAVTDYFAGYLYPTMAIQNLAFSPDFPSPLEGFLQPTPGLEDLLAIANTSTDPDEQAEALQQLCIAVAEQANIVPLATKSTTIGVRTDQVDADIPAFDGYDIYLRNITEYTKLG